MTNSVSTEIIPSKEAIELAVEKLASSAERSGCFVVAKDYRDGLYSKYFTVYTLAIALQEMSDAVKEANKKFESVTGTSVNWFQSLFSSFILPAPVDPLVGAMAAVGCSHHYTMLARELLSRGLQIVPIKEHTV